MKLKTYKESLNYLENFISNINFKRIEDDVSYDPLDRMRTLLGLLGNPEEKFKSVLVTGTAGKGSTAYLISHILKTAGYKVGLTISPHLQKVNERLQINGKEILDSEFASLVSSLVGKIEQMSKMKVGAPSYFEILLAMAFLYFAKEKVDLAVVEVGIEGKYDATNVLNPLMVILTNIWLDHTQILGDTVEKIASEAVGAIKGLRIKDKGLINNSSLITNHFSVVTGVKQPSVIKIVEERCGEVGAKLLRLGKDFDESIIRNYKPALVGDYQKENASLAVKAIRQLADFGFKVSEKNIEQALSTAFFPGRFEIVNMPRGPASTFPPASAPSTSSAMRAACPAKRGSNPSSRVTPRSNYTLYAKRYTLILDGAHNPAKMQAFISSLKKLFPKERKIFVIAFKKDKNIKEMLKSILPVADVVIATRFSMATDVSKNASADASMIKDKLLRMNYKKVIVEENSKKALEKAFSLSTIQQFNNSTMIIVTGSLYLVGEIRSKLQL